MINFSRPEYIIQLAIGNAKINSSRNTLCALLFPEAVNFLLTDTNVTTSM